MIRSLTVTQPGLLSSWDMIRMVRDPNNELGVIMWYRIADNAGSGGNTDAIVEPRFFSYLVGATPTLAAFAIQSKY